MRALRNYKEETDTGTFGVTGHDDRLAKVAEFQAIQSKFKTVQREQEVQSLDRPAFIAFFRYRRGWSKKKSKREWNTQSADPDVITNGKTGAQKHIMVRGIEVLRGIDGRTIGNAQESKTPGDEDTVARKFNRDLDCNWSDNFFKMVGGDEMRQGASAMPVLEDDDSDVDSSSSAERRFRKRSRRDGYPT